MTEAEWLECTDPSPMLWFLRGNIKDRKGQLYAVACCRRIWHLLVDERSRQAIEIADKAIMGEVSDEERRSTAQAAWDAEMAAVAALLEGRNQVRGASDAAMLAAQLIDGDFNSVCGKAPFVVAAGVELTLRSKAEEVERLEQSVMVRDIFGNPFRPVTAEPSWLTSTVVSLATAIYDDRAFDRLPILADALEDAGCTHEEILNHCRQPGEHVRGCWCVDLLLGKK